MLVQLPLFVVRHMFVGDELILKQNLSLKVHSIMLSFAVPIYWYVKFVVCMHY